MKILISLVTYTNHEVTRTCLASLSEISMKGMQVEVMVVNNDVNHAFSWKAGTSLPVTIVNQTENLGFSGGHNVALRHATKQAYDYVLVLNNDTILDKHFLVELLSAAEKKPQGGAFGPLIYFAPGHEFHKARYQKHELGKVIWYGGGKIDWQNMLLSHRGVDDVYTGQYTETEKTDFVTGCCMLLRVSALKKSGLFDERYFLYFEDSDLNMRLKNAGYDLYFVPESHIWHENAGSTGGSGSGLQDYFISRNRLLFGYTYASWRTKLALFRESIWVLRTGRKWQQQGIRDYYLGKFGKGSYKV